MVTSLYLSLVRAYHCSIKSEFVCSQITFHLNQWPLTDSTPGTVGNTWVCIMCSLWLSWSGLEILKCVKTDVLSEGGESNSFHHLMNRKIGLPWRLRRNGQILEWDTGIFETWCVSFAERWFDSVWNRGNRYNFKTWNLENTFSPHIHFSATLWIFFPEWIFKMLVHIICSVIQYPKLFFLILFSCAYPHSSLYIDLITSSLIREISWLQRVIPSARWPTSL